jgi:hypothetical protein
MKKFTDLRETVTNIHHDKIEKSKLGFKVNPKTTSFRQQKMGFSPQTSLKKELDVPSQTLKKKIVTPKQPNLASKVQLNMGEAKKWGYEKYRETSVATTGKTPEQRTKEIEDIQTKLKQQKAEFEARHAKKGVSETNQTPPFEPNKTSKPVTPGKHGQEYSKVRHLARMAMKKAAEKKDMSEATYQGKKVPLNKPMPGDVAKSKVYVDPDGDGKAQKVNFGDKTMTIKKNQPARKKSFLARHNCDDKKDKTTAGYWSCKAWK